MTFSLLTKLAVLVESTGCLVSKGVCLLTGVAKEVVGTSFFSETGEQFVIPKAVLPKASNFINLRLLVGFFLSFII